MARILLLEADRQLASHTAVILRRQGYEVAHFCDPQSAISSADTEPPNLVILNLALAGRSGIEFLYELRSYPDWQSVPAIVTGRLSPEEKTAYSRAFDQLNVSSFVPTGIASLKLLANAAAELLQPTQG